MDKFSKLPPGFFDYTGQEALLRHKTYDNLIIFAGPYGFEPVEVCPVGYEDTYIKFGSAAIGRCYSFTDPGGRKLMLCADSLPSLARAYLSSEKGLKNQPVKFLARVDVFRNRRKRHRCFTQIACSIFNEKISIDTDLFLIQFSNALLSRFFSNIEFCIYDFGIFEELFREFKTTNQIGKDLLYKVFIKRENIQDQNAALIDALIKIKEIGEQDGPVLCILEKTFPYLRNRIEYIKKILDRLRDVGIKANFKLSYLKAVEYLDGLAFSVIKSNEKKLIADGGGYHKLLNSLVPGIKSCYSFATTLEYLIHRSDKNPGAADFNTKVCHVFHLDSSENYFLKACDELRKNGLTVVENRNVSSLGRMIGNLPRLDNCMFCVIGKSEEEEGTVHIQSSLTKEQLYEIVIGRNDFGNRQ